MKRWLAFLLISCHFIAFGEKYIIPELDKNEKKELVITLKVKERRYLVKKGDTLEAIAKKFKMSVKELMRRNKIKDPKKLRAGQLILIDETGESL